MYEVYLDKTVSYNNFRLTKSYILYFSANTLLLQLDTRIIPVPCMIHTFIFLQIVRVDNM